jgi:hypothetical protein
LLEKASDRTETINDAEFGEHNSDDPPAIRTVIVPTPNKAQNTKMARPRAVTGTKSPYPMVVNAMKPVVC